MTILTPSPLNDHLDIFTPEWPSWRPPKSRWRRTQNWFSVADPVNFEPDPNPEPGFQYSGFGSCHYPIIEKVQNGILPYYTFIQKKSLFSEYFSMIFWWFWSMFCSGSRYIWIWLAKKSQILWIRNTGWGFTDSKICTSTIIEKYVFSTENLNRKMEMKNTYKEKYKMP